MDVQLPINELSTLVINNVIDFYKLNHNDFIINIIQNYVFYITATLKRNNIPNTHFINIFRYQPEDNIRHGIARHVDNYITVDDIDKISNLFNSVLWYYMNNSNMYHSMLTKCNIKDSDINIKIFDCFILVFFPTRKYFHCYYKKNG